MSIDTAPIIQSCYDLTLNVLRITEHFPRSARHILGNRIVQSSQDILELLARCNCSTDIERRIGLLEDGNERLFSLQLSIRLAYDVRCLSAGAHAQLSNRLELIRKQLNGWLRWSREQCARRGKNENSHLPNCSNDITLPGH
jgi:hypothetical protein